MKKWGLFLFVLTVFLITTHGSALAFNSPLQIGWVIGTDENNTAVILHTKTGGRKWVVQGDNTNWAGHSGNDISAVDEHTAWAALAAADASGPGIILYTSNGGATWTKQTLPEGVDSIKNIKGLTRHEAWAVSLAGTILHTTDGGKVWNIVPSGVDIGRVNRMDAIGCRDLRTGMISANVWIVDEKGGDWGMIHTLYNGDIWRQEKVVSLDSSGVHMVSAYSTRVVWAAVWDDGTVYRTIDGGETWEGIKALGPNDIDDLCAYSADKAWAVQYQGFNTGFIYHIALEDGEAIVEDFNPAPNYNYEGLTCINDQTALVVGFQDGSLQPAQPVGIILSTNDGGKSWENQPTPVDDVRFWKVSFVGARR